MYSALLVQSERCGGPSSTNHSAPNKRRRLWLTIVYKMSRYNAIRVMSCCVVARRPC